MTLATRAVLLDALGTLVELEPPVPRLREALGGDLDPAAVEHAMRAEMAYYRDHSHEAGDAASLAELRRRCAELLARELGREVSVEAMMSAIRFRAYADAAPALAELRDRGIALVCVSNWDCSLPDVLARVGLAESLDGVVASATAGHRKPDPAIFAAGLELAGCRPDEALVVGDTPEEDIAGAAAAGLRGILLDRGGSTGGRAITTLAEITERLRR
jgi:putative hydrolase of the HAD superfamily